MNRPGARFDGRASQVRAALLVTFSVISVLLSYATSILLARVLGASGFQDYAVAVAGVALLATLAESGTGKFALQAVPQFTAAQQWSQAAGFWRFSLWLGLLLSCGMGAAVVVWNALPGKHLGDHPLAVAALFLPAMTLWGVGIDFVMANRAAVAGAFVSRLLIPGVTLSVAAAASRLVAGFNAAHAMLCYGSGAVAGLAAAAVLFWHSSPPPMLSARPAYDCGLWVRQSLKFMGLAFLSSWMFRISILVLDVLPVGEQQVAMFAAALQSGCLILLVGKSTSKLFQPQMSAMIKRADWQSGLRLRRTRYMFVGTVCGGFLALMVAFGRQVLALFGPEFAGGYPALCLVSVGACAWTLFSLAPAYLMFTGQGHVVYAVTAVAAVLLAVLTALLGRLYGATGAGAAFCIVLTGMAAALLVIGTRHFESRRRNLGNGHSEPPPG